MSGRKFNKKKGHNLRVCKSSTCSSRHQVAAKKQHARSSTSELPGPGSLRGLKTLKFFEKDLDKRTAESLSRKGHLAIDTETEGLDYREKKLRLVQIGTEDGRVYIVRNPGLYTGCPNLSSILRSPVPSKIFHHAMFDLRFIKAGMRLEVAQPIECTKVLMKIVHPNKKSGIGSVLRNTLNVHLPDIKVDYSKWNEPVLTRDQLLYSAGDVLYLVKAFKELIHRATRCEIDIYYTAISACTDMAFLQVEGYTDLFDYPQNPFEVNLAHRNWWLQIPGDQDE